MNKMRIRKAINKGMNPVEILRMKEIAKREAQAMEGRATEEAFLFMLAIPLNVLMSDYWPKASKQKVEKYIKEVMSLYESVENGIVTKQELNDFLWETAGIKVDAEWLEGRNENKMSN